MELSVIVVVIALLRLGRLIIIGLRLLKNRIRGDGSYE